MQGWNGQMLDRYIGFSVISSTLVALMILVSIDGFFAFIDQLDDIGKNNFHLSTGILFVILTLPRRIHELFPMATLLGSLLGLGALASGSELIVMRAVGFSIGRIATAALSAGFLLMLLITLLGEAVAPVGEQMATNMREEALNTQVASRDKDGFWARDGKNFINIRKILANGMLQDVYVYEFDGAHRMTSATFAKSASYVGGKWEMVEVKQSFISDSGVITQKVPAVSWDSLLNPKLLNVVVVEPERLSTRDLSKYIDYMAENRLDPRRYELAFWVRIVSPFSALVMLLLAMPFVFGPLRSVGAGQRILVGVLFGLGFSILNKAINHAGQVFQFSPFLSAALPTLVFLVLGVYFLRKQSSV